MIDPVRISEGRGKREEGLRGVWSRRPSGRRAAMGNAKTDLYHMGTVERRFAEMIWEQEPIGSGELVKLAEDRLEWKKSTTYTVLRKLCDRGIFQNEGSIVTSILNREQYYGRQSKQFVSETFSGSLPRFIAAFAGEEKLTKKEIASLKALVEKYEKEE